MIKEHIKKFYINHILKIPDDEYKIRNYRNKGVTIGENCHIYSGLPTGRDCVLLTIGNHVTISTRCNFLLHDAAIGTLTDYKYTDILGKVVISDYCFIGSGSTILPGVHLAKRTIVAAGSVVTKSIDKEGLIIGGNPAKIIGTTKDYIEKNKKYFVNLNGKTKTDIKNLNNDLFLKRPNI